MRMVCVCVCVCVHGVVGTREGVSQHWRRKQQPTPGFLPGKSHGERSLAGYSSWGHERFRHNFTTKQQSQHYTPHRT